MMLISCGLLFPSGGLFLMLLPYCDNMAGANPPTWGTCTLRSHLLPLRQTWLLQDLPTGFLHVPAFLR